MNDEPIMIDDPELGHVPIDYPEDATPEQVAAVERVLDPALDNAATTDSKD